jgi:hypothetical protein
MSIAHWQTDTQAALELAHNPRLVSLEVWSFSREVHRVYGKPGSPIPITQTMSERFFAELMKSESLERLSISGTRLPASVFSMISRCKSLKELRFEDCEVDGGEIGEFDGPPTLTSLTLSGDFVTDDVLESLDSCPDLKQLVLSDAQISDEGMKSLYGLKQMKPDCEITFEPMRP